MKNRILKAISLIFLLFLIMPGLASAQTVQIAVGVDKTQFVGEQDVILKTIIVFDQRANPFWEELQKTDFSPFKLRKVTLGDRKLFDDGGKDINRDFREATFLLSLPADQKCGTYTIPSFSLGYSYFEGKREIKGKINSKAVKLRKVPVLVTSYLQKDTLTIGETNNLRITIYREGPIRILNYNLESAATDDSDVTNDDFKRWLKSLAVREKVISDLKKPNFEKFKILSITTETENDGLIIKESFEYNFAFYELGGKEFKIPSIHIWYLDSRNEKSQPQELVTSAQTILINRVVRSGRKTLEGLKTIPPASKTSIILYGYAPLALGGIFLLAFSLSTILSCGRAKQQTTGPETEPVESFEELRKKLLALKEEDADRRQTRINIRNEFVKVLGKIIGLSPTVALTKAGSWWPLNLRQAGFLNSSIDDISKCLSLLDKSILNYYGSIVAEEKTDLSLIWQCMEKALNVPEISKVLRKKHRKFLIF